MFPNLDTFQPHASAGLFIDKAGHIGMDVAGCRLAAHSGQDADLRWEFMQECAIIDAQQS